MRLRVSGEDTGDVYDLNAVNDGEADAAGVPQGDLLNAFAEGICERDPDRTAEARAHLVEALGEAAMVDAAAVIAAFNAYPRAADATGLPLEDRKAELTREMREELGLDALDTAGA